MNKWSGSENCWTNIICIFTGLRIMPNCIKEIAWALKFEDEFYFSRVFKKFTQVSPQSFRDRTGISIVADWSM
jgi:AraC family transcriptional activator of pobA